MHLYEKRRRGMGALARSIVLFCLIAALSVAALGFLTGRGGEEQAEALRDAIVRAAVTCYAVEGRYPESLDYLSEHYGVVIDAERFAVGYDVFAANLMPAVSVTLKGGQR